MAHPTLGEPVRYLADGGAPERVADHSAEGFQLARRLGADGWEATGHLSADGVVVVARSASVGWRRRARTQLAAADAPALPLADLLALDAASAPLVSIRVEGRKALDALVIAALGAGATERTWVRCGDLEVLARASADFGPLRPRLLHEAPLGAMSDGPERHAAQLRDLGIDGQAMEFGQWTGGLTAMFHRFGLLCVGRGAVHVRMIREFAAMGLDAVSSTHPERLDEARRAPGPTP
ncbi:MAG: hypothetical protein R2754_05490 [Microthrixaceae bacterium]